jgi:toxin ParE1/3/4
VSGAGLGPRRLLRTSKATSDLIAAAAYLSEAAGAEVANRFSDVMDRELLRLAELGHEGAPRGHLGRGVRLTIIGNFNIFFRRTDEDILILRVLHGRRKVTSRMLR